MEVVCYIKAVSGGTVGKHAWNVNHGNFCFKDLGEELNIFWEITGE